MGRRGAAAQVPECRFGLACTRKDCIYKHPPKKPVQANSQAKAAAKAAAAAETDTKVCFAFVAGKCQFGKYCRDKHPDDTSCRTIRERYARMDCQWGAGCRTDGCLYRHPTDAPAGPALSEQPVRVQPAVYAAGPMIVPTNIAVDESRSRNRHNESIPIPKAMLQSADLRNKEALNIPDPLERFLAVNAQNSGSKSAALLDLYFQSPLTFPTILDVVLPERLRMFQRGEGVWIVTGYGGPARGQNRTAEGSLYEAVRDYLLQQHYEFARGHDAEGNQCAFCVLGQKKLEDAMLGVRAVMLCGVPGSGKTGFAEALARKSGGRFRRVSQDGPDRPPCEKAWRSELTSAAEAAARSKAGSWWWDHAFSAERHYLVVCLRTAALKTLANSYGVRLPSDAYVHATLAYQPTGIDLRRWLGRPVGVYLRSFLVLECTAAPHTGELFEVILCQVRERPEAGAPARPATALHIPLTAPKTAARHLQVLNAVPLDRRILANSTLGSFRVRQVIDLTGSPELTGLCTLMHKSGDQRDTPVGMSFDAAALNISRCVEGMSGDASYTWTELGDAALNSLESLVILGDCEDSEPQWTATAAARCASRGLPALRLQVLRPSARETKVAQWMRVRSKCLLHCTADEANVAQFLHEGAPVLRVTGGVELPPLPSKEASRSELQKIVVLDRCNLERADRRYFLEAASLSRSEVIAVFFDNLEVPSHIVRVEPPSEQEGFQSVVRLKATAAASQELVKKWTEEGYSVRRERNPGFAVEETAEEYADYEERPPPAMATLSQWIEVQEQGGHQAASGSDLWGMPVDQPIDFPLELLPGSYDERYRLGPTSSPSSSSDAVVAGWGGGAELEPTADPGLEVAESARFDSLLMNAHDRGPWQQEGGYPSGQPGLGVPCPIAAGLDKWENERGATAAVHDEEDEDMDNDEQLAATLRCMGFDEEPSILAAQRAGGNLNVAVESMLRQGAT